MDQQRQPHPPLDNTRVTHYVSLPQALWIMFDVRDRLTIVWLLDWWSAIRQNTCSADPSQAPVEQVNHTNVEYPSAENPIDWALGIIQFHRVPLSIMFLLWLYFITSATECQGNRRRTSWWMFNHFLSYYLMWLNKWFCISIMHSLFPVGCLTVLDSILTAYNCNKTEMKINYLIHFFSLMMFTNNEVPLSMTLVGTARILSGEHDFIKRNSDDPHVIFWHAYRCRTI